MRTAELETEDEREVVLTPTTGGVFKFLYAAVNVFRKLARPKTSI